MGQFAAMFGIMSLVVQVVTELVQRAGLTKYTQTVAVIIGCIVAVTTQTGLLAQFGYTVTPFYVDWLFMGLALSGGGWVLDMVKKMGQAQTMPAEKK